MCVPCEDNMPAACAAQAPFDYKMTYPSHFIDHPQENCFQNLFYFNILRLNSDNFWFTGRTWPFRAKIINNEISRIFLLNIQYSKNYPEFDRHVFSVDCSLKARFENHENYV